MFWVPQAGGIAIGVPDVTIPDFGPDGLNLKAYNHRLGESGLSFFAQRRQAQRLHVLGESGDVVHAGDAALPEGDVNDPVIAG